MMWEGLRVARHKQATVFVLDTLSKQRCCSFNAVLPAWQHLLVSYMPLARLMSSCAAAPEPPLVTAASQQTPSGDTLDGSRDRCAKRRCLTLASEEGQGQPARLVSLRKGRDPGAALDDAEAARRRRGRPPTTNRKGLEPHRRRRDDAQGNDQAQSAAARRPGADRRLTTHLRVARRA